MSEEEIGEMLLEEHESLLPQAERIVQAIGTKTIYTDECFPAQREGLRMCRDCRKSACSGAYMKITGHNLLGLKIPVRKPPVNKLLFPVTGNRADEIRRRVERCRRELHRREDIGILEIRRPCHMCGYLIHTKPISRDIWGWDTGPPYCSNDCLERDIDGINFFKCISCSKQVDESYAGDLIPIRMCPDCIVKFAGRYGLPSTAFREPRGQVPTIVAEGLRREGFQDTRLTKEEIRRRMNNVRFLIVDSAGVRWIRSTSKTKERRARRYGPAAVARIKAQIIEEIES